MRYRHCSDLYGLLARGRRLMASGAMHCDRVTCRSLTILRGDLCMFLHVDGVIRAEPATILSLKLTKVHELAGILTAGNSLYLECGLTRL